MEQTLELTVAAFNQRDYHKAAELAERGCENAQGRDEAFWLGLQETCQGFSFLMDDKLAPAEKKLVAAMEKLRNFGYRYNNLEITTALAGIRQGVEEIRAVRERHKKNYDVTLLPQLKLAAKADD
jgi:hypothetical protein